MRRTIYLLGIAFLVSMVAFLSCVAPVKAYVDEYREVSTPNGYAEAYLYGTYSRPLYPFYRVHHEATIHTVSTGHAHFRGYSKTGQQLYNVGQDISGAETTVSYDPGKYNVIWDAWTETWAPNESGEYAAAVIGPPGSI
jgi:hypothetical protein